jgi:glycosyltransferase involved in cell wall biosynthesis
MIDTAPQISVVLPAHNEEGNVAPMAARLNAILGPLGSYEIVFVDDCSTDRTLEAIRALVLRETRRWPLYLIAETEASPQQASSEPPPSNIHRLPSA